jgi:AraC-like DNA-binding protein
METKSASSPLMNKACELIAHAFENHDWPGLRLLPIADQLGLSPWQFQRQFKDTLGISP